MDSSNLQSTQQLIRKDNQLKPVDKYKLWIERIKFFYPVSTQGDDIISLRQSLIDAFNVIDKNDTTFGSLEDKMSKFVSTMMYVIGANKFNAIEKFRNELYKSEKYADLVAIKYVFSHYKFQDIIYTIRPLTKDSYDDLRNRFDYVYKIDYKKAVKSEVATLENQLEKITTFNDTKDKYDKVENEILDVSDKIGITRVFDKLSKDECNDLLKEYAELLDDFNDAKRKYEKTKSTKNKRDKASERLQTFRNEHQFTTKMDNMTHEQRVQLVMKYKDLDKDYHGLYDKIEELKKDQFGLMKEGDIKQALDKLNRHVKATDSDESLTPSLSQIVDTTATSLKEHDDMIDETTYLSVEEWLVKHKYDERSQVNIVKRKLDALKKGDKVVLTDMNKESRDYK